MTQQQRQVLDYLSRHRDARVVLHLRGRVLSFDIEGPHDPGRPKSVRQGTFLKLEAWGWIELDEKEQEGDAIRARYQLTRRGRLAIAA